MAFILGFDIGNTNTIMGIYSKEGVSPERSFRFRTEKDVTLESLYSTISSFIASFENDVKKEILIEGIALSSVVPEVNSKYSDIAITFYDLLPLEINAKVKLGLIIHYDNYEELGVDRLVNAVAALNEYKKDCIIVDIGTACTFCVLHGDGVFDGGLIAPGIGITIDALADKASQLPRVDFERPDSLVAHNTIDAIKSGFFYGWLSMVEGVIDRIEKQYNKEFLLLLTGGFSEVIGKNLKRKNVIDPFLTMKGIKYIYDLNH